MGLRARDLVDRGLGAGESSMSNTSRRSVLMGAASLAGLAVMPLRSAWAQEVEAEEIYGAIKTEPFPVRGIDVSRVNPRFLRTLVDYPTAQPPGTIVIDPAHHFLYLVIENGQAIRYGVGVGREGFLWSGVASIQAKREWPDWYPPKEMFARQPEIVDHMAKLQSGIGMHGGPGNPLGARAMYLYKDGKDTLFRIHGTVEPYTIGTSVSSGCIRMMNQDVLDLYSRVDLGSKVVVLGDAQPTNQQVSQQSPRQSPRRRIARPTPEDANDAGVPQDPRPAYGNGVDPNDDANY